MTFDLPEGAGEVAFEVHMDGHVVIGHDHLANFHT
jgi:hypothetical protein